jgi:XRE family transcriptional regulator, regulator of sulfur utilization
MTDGTAAAPERRDRSDAITKVIGPRLRTIRQERSLSLQEVAEATDISTSFLSLVETGRSDITFTKLIRLLEFYDLSVSDLLPQGASPDQIAVTRSDEQRFLHSSEEGLDVAVLARLGEAVMHPQLAVYQPGGHMKYAAHKGEEWFYVLEGEIAVHMEDGTTVTFRPGDSGYYSCDRIAAISNVGNTEARLLAVASPPHF